MIGISSGDTPRQSQEENGDKGEKQKRSFINIGIFNK